MARSRNIKPGFFKNEKLVELPFSTRLLFAGLWTLADREGRLEDRPKRIKMEIFPADSVDVDKGLGELHNAGFVLRYRNSAGSFVQILAFKSHQTPHYSEKPSVIKAPELPENGPDDDSNTPGVRQVSPGELHEPNPPCTDSLVLIPDSLNLIPDSPIPDSGKERTRAKKRASPKTPVPEGFQVSERVRQWAHSKGYTQLDQHCEAFISKSKAKGYAYADWDEAFMGAIREDWAGLRNGNGLEHENRQAAEQWLRDKA